MAWLRGLMESASRDPLVSRIWSEVGTGTTTGGMGFGEWVESPNFPLFFPYEFYLVVTGNVVVDIIYNLGLTRVVVLVLESGTF